MTSVLIAAALALSFPDGAHSRTNRNFGGIPSVAVSPRNGRLWRTWYGGPTKGEDRNNYAILATSADGGRTWSAPSPCPFAHTNSRIFVRRLRSGALLLVKNGTLDYDFGGRDYQGRTDLYASVSDDDGATWIGGLRLHKGPCSYPDGDQGADGTVFLVFDNDRYGKQELFLRKFTEADVRKGGVMEE